MYFDAKKILIITVVTMSVLALITVAIWAFTNNSSINEETNVVPTNVEPSLTEELKPIATLVPTESVEPTVTSSPTATPEPTVTPKAPEPTKTPVASPIVVEPTVILEPTATLALSPTVTVKPTVTPTEELKSTDAPDPTESVEPTVTSSPTATPEPTATSEPTATPTPTKVPKPTKTPKPTEKPDEVPKLPADKSVKESLGIPSETYNKEKLPDDFNTEVELDDWLARRVATIKIDPIMKGHGFYEYKEPSVIAVTDNVKWTYYQYEYNYIDDNKNQIIFSVSINGDYYTSALNAMELFVVMKVDMYRDGKAFYNYDRREYSWPKEGLEWFMQWF